MQEVAEKPKGVAKIRYTHDAMIDLIITEPAISQGEIARNFGFTEGWISQLINSDAFQARLAERKGELTDPLIIKSIEEKMKGVVSQSLDIVMRKLEATQSADLALKVLEVGTRSLGMGAQNRQATTNVNFVVALPGKAADEMDWAARHAKVIEG